MINRIRWSALGAVLLAALGIAAAIAEQSDVSIALGFAAVTLAILSLNESP